MQANKGQNWSADDAFWDDAWADMNSKLDEKPDRRKGGLAWWPLYLGVAAVLVLILAMGASAILDRDETETAPSPPFVQAPALANPGVDPDDNKAVATAPVIAEASADKQALKSSETDIRQQLDQPMTTVATAQRTTTPIPAVAAAQPPATSLPTVTAAQATSTPPVNISPPALPADNDAVEENTALIVEANIWWDGYAPNPVPGIATDLLKQTFITEGILPLEIDQLFVDELNSLPTVPLHGRRFPNPLTLEAGLTSDFALGHRGGLVGIDYRITGGKKLSFPLSLRYRFDQLEINDSPLEEADQNGVSTGGTSTTEASDLLLIPQSISATAVEVGAGLAWGVTPRLRLSLGLSASYQLQALVNFEGQTIRSLFDQFEFTGNEDYSLSIDRGEAFLSTQTVDGASPGFTPWSFRANLGAAYDITPRLGVNLRATRLLAQPDRAGVLGLRNGRMEVGVSYRLR